MKSSDNQVRCLDFILEVAGRHRRPTAGLTWEKEVSSRRGGISIDRVFQQNVGDSVSSARTDTGPVQGCDLFSNEGVKEEMGQQR